MRRPVLRAPSPQLRAFLTELVIVVLGVLIALGAQQAMDEWKTRSKVADFRAAVNAEVANNLATYALRIAQGDCLRARLNGLEAWQRDWRDGAGPAWNGPVGRPLSQNPQVSVWQTGAQGVASEMPLATHLAYAKLYDSLATYQGLNSREIETWYALFAYDGAADLTVDEVNRLRGLIMAARSTNRSITLNYPQVLKDAAALGIKPAELSPDDIAQRVALSQLCDLGAGTMP